MATRPKDQPLHELSCKACDELLAAYKHAVKRYSTAELKVRGLLGDDFQLALKKLKRLQQACRDADDALNAHLSQHHGTAS